VQVLVDTCIWSLALRRQAKHLSASEALMRDELGHIVEEGRAELIGPIRQELLSGIRDAVQFERLSEHLRAFTDQPLTTPDYELAARFSNQCRAAGIAGTAGDFLICAVATDRKWPIFTCDEDFKVYGKAFPLGLYSPRR
jgi:predicted nucleic acid-binding protein